MQSALLFSLPDVIFPGHRAAITMMQPFVKDKGRKSTILRPPAIFLKSELLKLWRIDEAQKQWSTKLRKEQRRVDVLQQNLGADT
jgi:hypothetical protein